MILPTLLDIIDIFLVALLLYVSYKIMKRSGALNIFYGILAVLFIWVMVSYVFKLKLFGGILDKVVNVGVIAIIVLFQNEIRRFLVMLGSRRQWSSVVEMFSANQKTIEIKALISFRLSWLARICRKNARARSSFWRRR